MKIAGSDYFLHRNGNRNTEKYLARQVFFLSTRIHAPEVLKSLKDKVLPLYNQLFLMTDSSLTDAFTPDDICWNYFKNANKKYCNNLLPLKDIIDEWSDKYNLFDEWIKDRALKTLADWREFPPPLGKKLSWYEGVKVFTDSNPIPKDHRISSFVFTFSVIGWNPFFESWEKAKRRIISKVSDLLEKGHRKEREALAEDLAKELGYVKARNKRQIEKHMRWLIEYQIHEKPSGKICLYENNEKKQYDDMQIYRDEENNDKQNDDGQKYEDEKNNKGNKRKNYNASTIIKAINNTAELIGLTLRTKMHPNK